MYSIRVRILQEVNRSRSKDEQHNKLGLRFSEPREIPKLKQASNTFRIGRVRFQSFPERIT